MVFKVYYHAIILSLSFNMRKFFTQENVCILGTNKLCHLHILTEHLYSITFYYSPETRAIATSLNYASCNRMQCRVPTINSSTHLTTISQTQLSNVITLDLTFNRRWYICSKLGFANKTL